MILIQEKSKLNKKKYFLTNQIKKQKSLKALKKGMIKNLTLKNNLTNFKLNFYWNQNFDKTRLKNFVFWCFKTYGQNKTIKVLEILKHLGFHYATKAGLSLSIDDLIIPPTKSKLLIDAELTTRTAMLQYKNAQITNLERFQKTIETWNITSEKMKDDLIYHFKTTNIFNPLYMMAFSGARGNVSQVRQLVGMRGLMANPQGQIIDFPIQSNFREGLTLTEYVISCYGARKGVVDTALRTANAGYLTRRLVDVAQHVIISNFDCGTNRGLIISEMKQGNKLLFSLRQRLLGRVLAKDVQSGDLLVAKKNQEISENLAEIISSAVKTVIIRSPLTCKTTQFICQLCYGWSLAEGKLAGVGETVGIIAAQSIGEPGTQLTMRTFHTGGVFAGELLDQLIAPFDGIIKYNMYIPGNMIRTPQGKIAFLTRIESQFVIENCSNFNITKNYKIPPYTILFIRNKETVSKNQLIAQLCSFSPSFKNTSDLIEYKIYSDLEGEIKSTNLQILKKTTEMNDIMHQSLQWGSIWILSGKIYQLPFNSLDNVTSQTGLKQKNSFFPIKGDFVTDSSILSQILWINNYQHVRLSFEQKTAFFQKFINNKKIFIKNFNESDSQWLKTWQKFSKISNFKYLNKSIKTFNNYLKKDLSPINSSLNIYSQNLLLFLTIDKIRYKKLGYFLFFKQKQHFKNHYFFKNHKTLDILLNFNSTKIFNDYDNKLFLPISLESNSFVNQKNFLINSPRFFYQKLSNKFFEWFPNQSQKNVISSGLIKFSEIFLFKNKIQKKQKKKIKFKTHSNIKQIKLLNSRKSFSINPKLNYHSITQYFENKSLFLKLKQFNNKKKIKYLNHNYSFILLSFLRFIQFEKQQLSKFNYIKNKKTIDPVFFLIKPNILTSKKISNSAKNNYKSNINNCNLKKQLLTNKKLNKIDNYQSKKFFRFRLWSNNNKKDKIINFKKSNESKLMDRTKWIIDRNYNFENSNLNHFLILNKKKSILLKKYIALDPVSFFNKIFNTNNLLLKKNFYNKLQFILFYKNPNQSNQTNLVRYNNFFTILGTNFFTNKTFINFNIGNINQKGFFYNNFLTKISNIFICFNNIATTYPNVKTNMISYKSVSNKFYYLNRDNFVSKNKIFKELIFKNNFNKSKENRNMKNLKKYHSSFTYYIIKNQYRFAPSFQKQSINELENIYKKKINNFSNLTLNKQKLLFIRQLNNNFLSYLQQKLKLYSSKKTDINIISLIRLDFNNQNCFDKFNIQKLINKLEKIKKDKNQIMWKKHLNKLVYLQILLKQFIQLYKDSFNKKRKKLKLLTNFDCKQKNIEKKNLSNRTIINSIDFKKAVPIFLIKYKKSKITFNSRSFNNLSIVNHLLIRKPSKNKNESSIFFFENRDKLNTKKTNFILNISLIKLNSLNNIIINSFFKLTSFKWLELGKETSLTKKKMVNPIFVKKLGLSKFLNKNIIISDYQTKHSEVPTKLNLFQQSENKQRKNFNQNSKDEIPIITENKLLLYCRFFLVPKEYLKVSKNQLLFILFNSQKEVFFNPVYKVLEMKNYFLSNSNNLSLFQKSLFLAKKRVGSNQKLKSKKTPNALTLKNFLNFKERENNFNLLAKTNYLQKINKFIFNLSNNLFNSELQLFNNNRQGQYLPFNFNFNNDYGILKLNKNRQLFNSLGFQVVGQISSRGKNMFRLFKKSTNPYKNKKGLLYKNKKEFILTNQPVWICKAIKKFNIKNNFLNPYLINKFLKKDLKSYSYINFIKSIPMYYKFCEKNLIWLNSTFLKMIEFIQIFFIKHFSVKYVNLFCLNILNSSYMESDEDLKKINNNSKKINNYIWLINPKSRFLKLKQSNMFFFSKEQKNKIEPLFCIRKMQELTINNYQNLSYFSNTNLLFLSKKNLFKISERKKQTNSWSNTNGLIMKSQYHSIILNKQKISQKLIYQFPNLEPTCEQYFGIPLNKISNILKKKNDFQQNFDTKKKYKILNNIDYSLSGSKHLKKNKKQINNDYFKLKNQNYKIFKSHKSLYLFRYFFDFSIPITLDFSFQSSHISWNFFPNSNLANLKYDTHIKSIDFFNYLINKNKRSKRLKVSKLTRIYNYNNINKVNFINILNCIKMLLRQPCIDWSATQQINLGYQKNIFLAPTKTVLLVSKENTLYINSSIALTKILSNMNGEILYSFKNNKKKAINSIKSEYKRTNQLEFHEFLQKKDRSLFLTKSDQICLKFKDERNNELTFLKKYNLFKNQKYIRSFKIFKIKSSKQILLIFKILQKIHNNCQFSNQSIKTKLGLFIYQGDLLNTFFINSNLDNNKIKNIIKNKKTIKMEKNNTKSIIINHSGQIIHLNKNKLTVRKGQPIFFSPHCIFHSYNNDFIEENKPVLSLPYQQLKTGDIVQGIPKIEQLFEARLTFAGKVEDDNLTNILEIVFQTYKNKLTFKLAVRRSIELVQMIIVNSIQRIYRSQGVNISDKHLEVIVKQMTKKVEIIDSGQSGFLIGEHFDLDVVELWNSKLSKIKHVKYKPLILGISKASLQTDSFLSAASFQYTTRILSQSAFFKKRDFLKGLKENIIVGNIIPAGTGYLGNIENLFEIN